ncbi:uncharacterized protein LOC102801105 isoform X2 [Saccoglossus kowalevskii]
MGCVLGDLCKSTDSESVTMATSSHTKAYEYDFYISSQDKEWIKNTACKLEKTGLKGRYDDRDMLGLPSKMKQFQNFNQECHKIIYGFGPYSSENDHKSELSLVQTFENNENCRIIVVKLTDDSQIPDCFANLYALDAKKDDFISKLEESVRFNLGESNMMGKKDRPPKLPQTNAGMAKYHKDILRKHMNNFAHNLPYQSVLDHMPQVFTLEDESRIKNISLTDFEKRRKLVEILMMEKNSNAFQQFVKVLEKVCSFMADALKKDATDAETAARIKNLKI